MTRKKFIKQLGGYGITRNTANGMAEITRKRGGTYAHALAYFQLLMDEFNRRVKKAISDAILYGEGTTAPLGLCNYFPAYSPALDFEIKPLGDPPPWRHLYALDTKLIDPEPVVLWPKVNPHLDGYSAKVHIVDELPPLNPNVRMDGTTQRIVLHPNQPATGGGGHD